MGLFLVRSGSVAVYRELPYDDYEHGLATGMEPMAVYRGGWFVNCQGLLTLPTQHYAVAYEDGDVLYWSPKSLANVSWKHPRMAEAISKQAMKQMALDMACMDPEKLAAEQKPPTDVSARLARIRVAESLAKLGLFDTCSSNGKDSFLPKLPTKLRQDVRTAFEIFTCPKKAERDIMLQHDKVDDALMFAGILHCKDPQDFHLDAKTPDNDVTFEEFERIAHEAAQMRLTPEKVSTLEGIFKSSDKDRSGSIDKGELADLMSQVFVQQHLTEEEIHSLFEEWLEAGMKHFDKETFIAFIARFAKLHEQDWHLCIAFKDLLGEDVLEDDEAPLKASTLEKVCQPLLSDCDLDHLLFMTNWNRGAVGQVSLRDIVAVLLMPPWRREPPLPKELITDEDCMPVETPKTLGKITSALQTLIKEADWNDSSATNIVVPTSLTWRQKLHVLLEEPGSSRCAGVIWFVMALLIVCSILTLIASPLLSDWQEEMLYVEGVFTIIFTIEYFLRLISASAFGRPFLRWVVQPDTLCDLVAIVPFYVMVAVGNSESAGDSIMLRCVRLIRLSRIGRISKLHSTCPICGPVAMVLLIVWFIYLKSSAK